VVYGSCRDAHKSNGLECPESEEEQKECHSVNWSVRCHNTGCLVERNSTRR